MRRERLNGSGQINYGAQSAQSPTQTTFPPLYSPTKTHDRQPLYNSQYNTPQASLPMPHSALPPRPVSPISKPAIYPTEYQDAAREKSTSAYYDPTSDSGERVKQEPPAPYNYQAQTPQVKHAQRKVRSDADTIRTEIRTTIRLAHQMCHNTRTAHTPLQWQRPCLCRDHQSHMLILVE